MYLEQTRKLVLACGLVSIPCRRTFDDRRLKIISTEIKEKISTMGYLFVSERLMVEPSITAIDSTLLKAKGPVWYKSSMKKGVVPRSGIDTDAKLGHSYIKGWIFGYNLHLTSTTAGKIVVPLTADVTTANMHGNRSLA